MYTHRLMAAFVGLLFTGAAAGQAVKISQVFGGGGNPGAPYARDFVELFNAGVGVASLAGWSLQYATAGGSSWQVATLPAATIQPGGYFLVQMSNVGTVGLPLPTPDHVANPAIAMASTSGKLALVSSASPLSGACPAESTIIDLVGFGASASCFEGTGPAPAPSNTAAILRADDGCADSGNNTQDFAVGDAAPRNSAVSRPHCPGADLSVQIVAPYDQLVMHEAHTVEARVRNNGPDAATGIVLRLTLPANGALLAWPEGTLPIENILEVPLPDLAADEEHVVILEMAPFSGASLALAASVESAIPDANPGNSATVTTTPIFSFQRARLFTGVLDDAGQIRAVDVESGAGKAVVGGRVSGLAADNENRRFFVSDGTTLTLIPWNTLTPIVIGSITGANGSVDGLAWHSNRRRLLGTTTNTIYEIDIHTAAAKVLRTLPAGADFGGIDYEVSSNRLVAANNSASTAGGLSGRGFYRIHPYSTDLVFVTAYPERSPGTPETDLDACAAGEGHIYGVADQAEWLYRYNTSTPAYLTPLRQQLAADHGESGAAWAPEFYSQSPGANLGIEIIGPGDCVQFAQQALTFDVVVRNYGPSYALAPTVTVTLPANAAFNGSTPAVVAEGNVLTIPLIGLAAYDTASLRVTMTPAAAGVQAVSAVCAATTSDALPRNNTATRDFVVQTAAPAAPAATAVLSNIGGARGVPGQSLELSGSFGRVFRSPSGHYWMMSAGVDAPAASDRVLLRGDSSSFEIVAREGVSFTDDSGLPVGDFGPVYAVLDSGDFGFSTDGDPDPTVGEIIVRSVNGVLSTVAEQGSWNLATGMYYRSPLGAVHLQSNGHAAFTATVGSGDISRQAFVKEDGATLIAQSQLTTPAGQMATDRMIESLGTGAAEGHLSWVSAAGDKWASRVDLEGPAASDICLVIDNTVRIQKGFRVPGSALMANVNAIHAVEMNTGNGDVYCRGSNADGRDWVWRNGAIIASTTTPIAQGMTEQFADTTLGRCFTVASGSANGDVLIGGFTDSSDANANEVLVLNNQRVVLRENDPIDLDGDGQTSDDDARVHGFRENGAFISDDGWVYAQVRVRSGSSVCLGTPTEVGQALVRVRVGCTADFDRDGNVGVPDIFAYLSAWFAGSASADIDGVGGVGVPDIFAFLSLWFAACA